MQLPLDDITNKPLPWSRYHEIRARIAVAMQDGVIKSMCFSPSSGRAFKVSVIYA